MLDRPQKQYLQRRAVRERYGGVSDMWVHRRLKDDPLFPRPLKIAQRDFFAVDELDQYDELKKEESDG